MVRLHVVDHQIIQGPAVQRAHHVFQKLTGNRGVDRVDQGRLVVQDQIGVIGDAAGDREEVFKQRKPTVAAADPNDGITDISRAAHRVSLLSKSRNSDGIRLLGTHAAKQRSHDA